MKQTCFQFKDWDVPVASKCRTLNNLKCLWSQSLHLLLVPSSVVLLTFSRYDERIDRVEGRITAHLRDQLGTAKNANEMFRIFSRFNALFVRPRIRGAIRKF